MTMSNYHELSQENIEKIKSKKISAANLVDKFDEHRDPRTAADLLLILKDIKTYEYENINHYIEEIESYRMDDEKDKETQKDKISGLKADAQVTGNLIIDLESEYNLYNERMTYQIRERRDVLSQLVADMLFKQE